MCLPFRPKPLLRLMFFLLCFIPATISCTDDALYRSYQSVPIDGWDAADPVAFQVDTLRQPTTCHILLNVRTSAMEAYDFRTLYLEVRQQWNGRLLRCDTIACLLSDERGEIEGDGVMRYQYTFPVSTVSLPAGSVGYLRVRHLMRREILEGISDIGIEIKS